ncbi:hydrolytic enzyme protein [Rutstroemia sp. NJR-2017a BVV2]|nr:hydrolytic enzyme protein [Rutstroemia sp. NJR-2017a BVV2]
MRSCGEKKKSVKLEIAIAESSKSQEEKIQYDQLALSSPLLCFHHHSLTMRPSTILLLFASTAHASVTCLKVGATATARWTNSAGKSCTWSGAVGGNFGSNSVNGGDDANCGSAYTAAEDDYLLGGADGCSQTNPSLAASAPSVKPVCV